MDRKNKKGFTLIELLVAMGIIAVLVTLSIVAIGIVQRSLRNTQRRDVANTLRLWIVDFKTNSPTNTYPASDTIRSNSTTIFYEPTGEVIANVSGATVPADGSTSGGTLYCYRRTGSGNTFQLGIWIEPGNSIDSSEVFGDNTAQCGTGSNIINN